MVVHGKESKDWNLQTRQTEEGIMIIAPKTTKQN